MYRYQQAGLAPRTAFRLAGIAIALSIATPATALELGLALRGQSDYDSNGKLTGDNGMARAELSNSAALLLDVSEQNPQLLLRGSYDLGYESFDKDTNADRSRLNGDSELVWNIVGQRLSLVASHTISEVNPDRELASATADDQQRRQEISAGPFLRLPLSSVDFLNVQAQYAEVYYDQPENDALASSLAGADNDSEAIMSSLSWVRALSDITSVHLGYQYREIERDRIDSKLEFQRMYAGLQRQLRVMSYELSLGSNESTREGASGNSGFYYQASLRRDTGAVQTSASATKQRTESSLGITGLRFDAAIANPEPGSIGSAITQENSSTEGAVDITFIDFDYRSRVGCKLCSYGFELAYTESDYREAISADADDRISSGRVFYDYRLTPKTSLALNARYDHKDFTERDEQDEYSSASLYFTWQASRSLELRFGGGYEQEKVQSDDAENYYNSFGSVGFRYQLLERR